MSPEADFEERLVHDAERFELPAVIPGFNWGAFFIPPIWGVAHGQWAAVFFLPLWVFVDNILQGPRPFGMWSVALGWVMFGLTLGAQALFAAHANRVAWHRVAARVSADQFARRQRIWGAVGAVTFIGMATWITLFQLGYRW